MYETCLFHFVEDDHLIAETFHDCRTGKLLCGEHKIQTIDLALKFVKEQREKKKKLIDKARDILRLSST